MIDRFVLDYSTPTIYKYSNHVRYFQSRRSLHGSSIRRMSGDERAKRTLRRKSMAFAGEAEGVVTHKSDDSEEDDTGESLIVKVTLVIRRRGRGVRVRRVATSSAD